jgi:hypothetical protein
VVVDVVHDIPPEDAAFGLVEPDGPLLPALRVVEGGLTRTCSGRAVLEAVDAVDKAAEKSVLRRLAGLGRLASLVLISIAS